MPAPSRNSRLVKIADPTVIGLPLILTSTFIAMVDQTSAFLGAEPGLTLRSIFFGQVTIALFLSLARFTWLNLGRSRPGLMISTIAISQIVGQQVASSSLPELSEAYVAGFDRAMFQTVALVFAAWLIASAKEHRNNLENLENRQSNLMMARNLGQARLQSERDEVIRQVNDVLDKAVEPLKGDVTGLERDIVTCLNRASEDALRPLSHQLAKTTEPFTISPVRRPRPHWKQAVFSVVATPLIAPKAMAFFMTFLVTRSTIKSPQQAQEVSGLEITGSGLQASVDVNSFVSSLFVLLAVCIATYSAAILVRRISRESLKRSRVSRQWIIGIAGIIVISILTQGSLMLINEISWLENQPAQLPITNPIWFVPVTVVAIILGIARALENAQRDVVARLRETNATLTWETVRISDELHAARQHLSQVIHGPIRAALLASAMEISLALQRKENVSSILPGLRERIEATKKQLREPIRSVDLEKEIAALRTLWTGVCEITSSDPSNVFPVVVADPVCASAVHAVIQEGVANAIFHAGAKQIQIAIMLGEDCVTVLVSNDGSAVLEPSKRGLGSDLLDEVSTEWSITPLQDRTELRAVIPLGSKLPFSGSRNTQVQGEVQSTL